MSVAPNTFLAYLAQKLEAGGSETTVYIDRITTRTGETIATADFATFGRGILTVNPDGDGDASYPEYISFTAVDSSNVALTGCTRGLSAKSNSAVAANKRFHPAGTPVVISFGAHNIQDILDYIDAQVAAVSIGTASVVTGIAGETLVAGNLVYLKNDGKWWKTDADTASTVEGVQLGIAQGAGSADGAITGGVMLRGLDSKQTGLVAGTTYYASNTGGGISSSPGTTSKVIGVARSATALYFDPQYASVPTEKQQDFLDGVVGMIVPYGGSTAPTGFLLCDGSAVSRTTYAALFAVLSTSYGTGDGSTTFNVPDLRSSVPVGMGQKTLTFDFADADVTVATDEITVPSNDYLYTGQAVVLSNSGGALPTGLLAGTYYVIRVSDTVVKLAASVAAANAGTAVDITAAAGGGTHTLTLTMTNRARGDKGGTETQAAVASHYHTYDKPSPTEGGTNASDKSDDQFNAVNTGTTGNDAPNNMPPYTVVNYIIKY